MNIHSTGKNKIIVELSKEDMNELDITYEEMDYSRIETRRVIWTILEKVRVVTGKDIDPTSNLLIEATADSGGGCVLSFTVNEKQRLNECRRNLRLTKNDDSVIYEFDGADALLDMIKNVGGENITKPNRLFRNKNKYRLVLDKLPCADDKKIIEEFADCVGRDDFSLAFTLEHWDSAGQI